MRWILATVLFLSLSLQAEVVSAKEAAAAKETAMTENIAEVNVETAKNDAEKETQSEETAKLKDKKESEIPLNLDAPKKASEEGHPLFKILLAISMMGMLGTGVFIFLRKYSKTSFAAGKNNEIRILTQHFLGPKKSLAIIRVAGESILIGITDQNINMIKSLALLDDEVPEATPNDFSGVLNRSNSNGGEFRMQSAESLAQPEALTEDEEFSIRGVKDVVSKKLKGMRSFQ